MEDLGLNKWKPRLGEADWKEEVESLSPEQLAQKAREVEAERARFAALTEDVQLEEALRAGHMSVEEYARKRGLRAGDANVYRDKLEGVERNRSK